MARVWWSRRDNAQVRTVSRKVHGERDGTRALIEVLLPGRHIPHEHLGVGPATALRAGALTGDAVALKARKVGPGRG